MAVETTTKDPLRRAALAAGRFVFAHSYELVPISVAWFLASLPVVTIGPATLGAYAAICSLREADRDSVDWERALALVRAKFVETVALSGLAFFLGAAFLLYAGEYLRTTSTVHAVMAVASLYALAFLLLILVPTFIALARGYETTDALRQGYAWTTANAVTAVLLGSATVLVFAVTALLTIGFVLLFPALAFSLHVEVVDIDRLNGAAWE